MSEEKFPAEMKLLIVDDLYVNYELGFEDDDDTLHIYCNTCEDIVGSLSYDNVSELADMDLYERILKAHRKL